MATLTLIAGVAGGGAIGRNNELLVRLPEDMAHFKALTLQHTVIMGRKTWDSIPARFRPLVQRRNIVLSRQAGLSLPGAEVFSELDAALASCAADEEVFVMGGAEIYALALPRADRLELTEFELSVDADAFFPLWNPGDFAETSRRTSQAQLPDGRRLTYHFVRYQRRR